MKTSSLALTLLVAAGLYGSARASLFSDNFEMLVVANRAPGPMPDTDAASCVLMNGGYVEAGDPIAGEKPPAPADVISSVNNAMAAAGFRMGGVAPTVAVTLFYGAIRVDHREARTPYAIYSNARARIELVSSSQTGAEVENHILGRKNGGGQNLDASSPVILAGPTRTTSQLARQPRYFVILTAFDYQSIGPGKTPRKLWEAKFSAQQTAGGMDEVIPALVGTGGAYIGKSMAQAKIVQATLAPAAPRAANDTSAATRAASGSDLDQPAVDALLAHERLEYSGTTENPGN